MRIRALSAATRCSHHDVLSRIEKFDVGDTAAIEAMFVAFDAEADGLDEAEIANAMMEALHG